MNKVILMGRLTRDPEVRYSQGERSTAVARYTLAVDRTYRRNDGEQNTDFIGCVAFGRTAEFAEKYLRQGTKIAITGRIQTGSYVNKDGVKVYTTDVVVEDQEFAESKAASQGSGYNGGQGGYNSQGGFGGQGGYNQGGFNANGGYNNQGGFGGQGGYNSQGSGFGGAPQQSAPVPADQGTAPASAASDGFMNIPEGIDEELPFN